VRPRAPVEAFQGRCRPPCPRAPSPGRPPSAAVSTAAHPPQVLRASPAPGRGGGGRGRCTGRAPGPCLGLEPPVAAPLHCQAPSRSGSHTLTGAGGTGPPPLSPPSLAPPPAPLQPPISPSTPAQDYAPLRPGAPQGGTGGGASMGVKQRIVGGLAAPLHSLGGVGVGVGTPSPSGMALPLPSPAGAEGPQGTPGGSPRGTSRGRAAAAAAVAASRLPPPHQRCRQRL